MPQAEYANSSPFTKGRFSSFDRSCQAESLYCEPERYAFWDECTAGRIAPISRGAGLSYAPASFSPEGFTVEHRHFNRLLDFDSATNVLEVEAGATLGQIYDFAVARGLYLAIQPGHPNITVGGCLAPDVHGKNQYRDGTFIAQTEAIRLFHPYHGILDLSARDDSNLFRLTCGGFGLTGNIITAKLRLLQAPARQIELEVVPLDNILDLPEYFTRLAQTADLLYSWHDFTTLGKSFGHGFVVKGTFGANGDVPGTPRVHQAGSGDSLISRTLPFSLWNAVTLPVFNAAYRWLSCRVGSRRWVSMFDFLFPVAGKMSYFELFGKNGFHECQVVIPESGFRSFVEGVRDFLKRTRIPISLASAKLFRGERELLRFTGNGICLALDFPRTSGSAAFGAFLDDLVRQHGAWPNIIKDSRLSNEVVRDTYPGYEAFRKALREFDPKRLYRSELSERLGL